MLKLWFWLSSENHQINFHYLSQKPGRITEFFHFFDVFAVICAKLAL